MVTVNMTETNCKPGLIYSSIELPDSKILQIFIALRTHKPIVLTEKRTRTFIISKHEQQITYL